MGILVCQVVLPFFISNYLLIVMLSVVLFLWSYTSTPGYIYWKRIKKIFESLLFRFSAFC